MLKDLTDKQIINNLMKTNNNDQVKYGNKLYRIGLKETIKQQYHSELKIQNANIIFVMFNRINYHIYISKYYLIKYLNYKNRSTIIKVCNYWSKRVTWLSEEALKDANQAGFKIWGLVIFTLIFIELVK